MVQVSACTVYIVDKSTLTHGFALAEDAQDQEGLEKEEDDDEEQGYKLVERV